MKNKMTEYDDETYYGIDNEIKITKQTNDWAIKYQLFKKFQLNSNSCPKEEKILFSKNGRKIKIFGRKIIVKGLFRLPEIVKIEKDTKLNPHMFPKKLFVNREAKIARAYLCETCPINNCNYKIKKESTNGRQ